MAIVERAPTTNYLNSRRKGVNRHVQKKGISLTWDGNRRPIGTSEGQPDTRRSAKGVRSSDNAQFQTGRGNRRGSVYARNNFPKSIGWSGPRRRTGERSLPRE